MVESNQREQMISRPELLYLLNRMGVKNIAGGQLNEWSLPAQKLGQLLQDGEQSLIDRHLAERKEGDSSLTIDPELESLMTVIAKRDRAFVLVRGTQQGKQLFIFNMDRGKIVEHTLPREGVHRLAPIADSDAFLARLKQIIPLASVTKEHRPEFKISEPDLEKVISEIRQGKIEPARQVLASAGMNAEYFGHFTRAIAAPEFTLSLACLRIDGETTTGASSVSVFADQQSAWGIWPHQLDAVPPVLIVYPSGVDDVFALVSGWIKA
jgi:hypothetical protein